MTQVYTIHNFLYTLNYENNVEGHSIEFVDRNNNVKKIQLSKIEIGTSPVSCKLYDKNDNRYIVPLLKIKKVFFENELVFDNTSDNSSVKIIKGYK